MSRRSRAWLIVLTGLLVFFALLGWVVEAWTEWLWFDELKATQVFTGQLGTRVGLFAVFGLLIGAFIFGNLFLAFKLRPFLPPTGVEQQTLERYRYLLGPRLNRWFALVAVAIGLFAGLAAQGHWQQWMLFDNAQPFGQVDPEFGVDIGFYVFKLPFWQYLLGTGFTVVVLALIGSLAVHYLYGGVRLSGDGDRMTTGARAHLTTLVAVFVILKAIAYVLDRRALLLDTITGTGLTGAGYTDINALLPAKEMLTYISVIVAVAILVFSNAVMRNLTWPGVALGLLGVAAVAIGGIYPWGVQTFEVDPSRNVKEAQYIQRNIEATRGAYGLDISKTTPYSSDTVDPPASLASDKTIVPNIRLLDPAVVSEAYTQLSQVRSFYHFGDKLDIDRYTINGKQGDYVVGLREISYKSLLGTQDNWINRHTVFTHGYGLVAAPANEVRCGGQPYFVSGFLAGQTTTSGQCASVTDQLPVDKPRVYYGEQMTEYAIVGKSAGGNDVEYDRPTGETSDEHFTYEGSGGVAIGSTWRRLLYSIKYAESNFLLAGAINDNSKILYERDPRTRVQKVAPFLTMDGDPYPAAVDGRIVWIIDGYTTAANFPYSQRVDLQDATNDSLTGDGTFRLARQDINYIRNSVKATVDAYDGTVKLYEFDDKDPVLKAWNAAFGGDLITPKSEVPPELAKHFRYPADLFKVQRDLLTRFHVTDPNAFYTEADFWAVPDDPARSAGAKAKQPPYYLLTQLPGQTAERFQLTAAVTPRNRQNLSALLSASYVEGKPTLELLELRKDGRIPGPAQAQQTMENDPAVRQQLNIWGANVIKGNLLSLPYGGGMLYVEPIYLRSSGERSVLLMKKVLLNYGDKVAFADTLSEGIKQLVGTNTGTPPVVQPGQQPPPVTGTSSLAAAAAKVDKAIDDLRAAQQSGNFEAYGKALAALEAAMKEFEAANAGASPTPTPTPTPTKSG